MATSTTAAAFDNLLLRGIMVAAAVQIVFESAITKVFGIGGQAER